MILKTKRTYIRKFKEDDIDAFMLYRNNLDWMKYQSFKGLSKEDYRSALLNENTICEGAQFAVFCNGSNELLGDIYLKIENDNCWIGYTINPTKARQGLMFEVVSSVLEWLRQYNIDTICAGVEADNMASIHLLNKLDFTFSHIEDGEHIFKLKL